MITPEQFKEIKKKYNLTNQKIAILLQVSLSLVKKWSTGERPITPYLEKSLTVNLQLLDIEKEEFELEKEVEHWVAAGMSAHG